MGRCVAPKHHLLLVLDGVVEGLDVGRIRGIVYVIGNAGAVIDAGQFPLEVPLQGVVVVDALDYLGRQVGFLVGEVDEFLEVREAPGDLAHRVHVAVELVHHEARAIISSLGRSGGDKTARVCGRLVRSQSLDRFSSFRRIHTYYAIQIFNAFRH